MNRIAFLLAAVTLAAPAAHAAELGGSPSSMVRQHEVAVDEDYSFMRSRAQVQRLVESGDLVRIDATGDFVLSGVSFPYARPSVRDFVLRLAAEYRDSTGSRLVVTSLTRPTALQPRNAHQLSVHPAGMAVDFRVPTDPASRAFLERRLLAMEKVGALDATREKRPPHYHVAVFPEAFARWAAKDDAAAARRLALAPRAQAAPLAMQAGIMSPAPDDSGSPWLAAAMMAALGLMVPVGRRERRRVLERRAAAR